MKQQAKGRETKPNQFRDTITGELVNSDKQNQFWKANTGEAYTGNTANLKPVAEESAANVRAVPTTVTVNNPGSNRPYKPNNIEVGRKSPKGIWERAVVDRNSADYGKMVKEGWSAIGKPKLEEEDEGSGSWN